jgi:hypothetical protein
MAISKKYLLQKKYIAFFTIVPLLALSAIIPVPCPVCQGTGIMNSMPEMEHVKVIDIDYSERFHITDICETYILYIYDMTLKVVNEGTTDAKGWVQLILRETAKGRVMDRQYVEVEIAELNTADISFTVYFKSGFDESGGTEVHAEVLTGEVIDDTCSGTGHITLHTWFITSVLTDNFEEIARDKEYRLPNPNPGFVPEGEDWDE